MNKKPALLFYCQHTMGMGHLVRSLTLADALTDCFRVVLLNGGVMPAGLRCSERLEIINLPPLSFDHGQLVSRDTGDLEKTKSDRRELILEIFRSVRPEVLLIELFPFGRKKFEFELLPLLEECRRQTAPPLVTCSLRDILVSGRKNQEKFEERAITIANDCFDLILVHADPAFASLGESLQSSASLQPTIQHTGFVVAHRPQTKQRSQRGPILISAGGGRYGGPLFRTAIAAHALRGETEELKVVAGPFLPDEEWEWLQAAAAQHRGVQIVRSVPDLFEELRRASVSISQCGYNTALEVVQAGLPALVVPFADGGEDEQIKRARRLAQLGALSVLDQHELRPERLAREIDTLFDFQPRKLRLDLNGARRSAEILDELTQARRVSWRQAQLDRKITGRQI